MGLEISEEIKQVLGSKDFKEWREKLKGTEPSGHSSSQFKISDKEIEIISEKVIIQITKKLINQEPISEELNNYLKKLEPKTIVLKQKEFSTAVRITGIVLLSLLTWYWIFFFFIVHDFEPLVYTTYITLILISLTLINKFESVLLNSITCISVYGFIMVSIWLATIVKDVGTLIGGPILHGVMAGVQLFIILHRKIALSKRYLFLGFLFYLIFLNSIDQIARLIAETNTEDIFPEIFTSIFSFYVLGITCIFIYLYKKKYGILFP
ncbi:MAG: hypothetical protein EU529_11700 [Promethearchaeota archaeon]|nr:MAG: hypothetical protein EU529_11700 [Candidatus Lokiarchaeota archaeon]